MKRPTTNHLSQLVKKYVVDINATDADNNTKNKIKNPFNELREKKQGWYIEINMFNSITHPSAHPFIPGTIKE